MRNTIKCFYAFLLIVCATSLNAQVTPLNADSDAQCGEDCFDLFSWSPFENAAGDVVSGEGEAADAGCNTILSAEVEYVGNDLTPDYSGTTVNANTQGSSPWTDEWTFTFSEDLTNPIVNLSGLFGDTGVSFADCNGVAITATDISSGDPYDGSGNDEVQLIGTFNCFVVTANNDRNDGYAISVGTCLSAAPLPPCTDCGENSDYEYLTLTNAMGDGTGATADVELNGVLYGSAEVLFSNLSIAEDLRGSAFGAFASGNAMEETFVLEITLCEPITVQQVDVLGLETDSEVWIGNSLSGTGQAATPEGLTLMQCGGPITMAPIGANMVENVSSSCSNQGNGNYTVGAVTTDILYFKYNNPAGSCNFDKATFRIGVCVPDGEDAIPVCPLTYLTYATDVVDYVDNGPDFLGADANAFQVMRDANGVFFDMNCSQIENDVADIDGNGDGDVLDPEDLDINGNGVLDMGNMIATTVISPCAELVEEEDCTFCDPPPPCVDCPAGTEYAHIRLQNFDETTMMGDVFLDGKIYGTSEVLFDDLDVSSDLSGNAFGAFDTDGGTLLMKLSFCEPIMINQLDIRGLETESQTSVGTMSSSMGADAVLSGLAITQCDGSEFMDVEADGVMVINDHPRCSNQGNGAYTVAPQMVSELYFKYYNPDGGCTYDKAVFRIGTCIAPVVDVVPTCPLSLVTITTDPDDVIANGVTAANTETYVQDADGVYFDFQSCTATALQNAIDNMTPVTPASVGPCAEVVNVEDCSNCEPVPPCVACPTDSNYEYLDLRNYDEATMMGEVYLDDILYGTSEVLFEDLDVNVDLSGTRFGAFDNNGGTLLMKITLCDAINVQQLDVLGLETESQASIGTMASTMGADAVLSGLTITQCDGPAEMDVEADGSTVINDASSCANQGDGSYTVDPQMVTELYFKYFNPEGGCRFDKATFRIGTCVAPPVDVVPSCPLTLVTVTTDPDDVLANGITAANTDQYVQDSDGVYFDFQSCTATALQNAIDNMTPVAPAPIGPCAEVVAEEDCTNCPVEPTCMDTNCGPDGEFSYISLEGYDDATNTGFIELDGAEYGTFEVLTGDNGQDGELDVNVDANGQIFGAFDNNGGTLLMKLEFCEPLTIDEVTIRGLEVMSEASIGTTATTEGIDAVLSGITLMDCDVHPRMTLNDGADNLVITDGPGCGANPTSTYTTGGAMVSTLYLKYHNPEGGCRFDYLGFKIGTCILDIEEVAVPECKLEVFQRTTISGNTSLVVQDANGDYFDYDDANWPPFPLAGAEIPEIEVVRIGTCDELEPVCGTALEAMDTKEICKLCFQCPVISGITLPTDSPICQGSTFDVTATGLDTMSIDVNNGADFGIEFVYFDGATPPANAYTGGTSLGTVAHADLTDMESTATLMGASIPVGSATIPGMTYNICAILDINPATDPDIADPTCQPQQCMTINILDCQPELTPTKSVVSSEQSASGVAGNLDITFEVEVCNTGNVNLTNLMLSDDLATNLGSTFVDLLSPPAITSSTAVTDPNLDPFNGTTAIDIFDGTSGLLEPGDCVAVQFIVETNPNAEGAPDPLVNTVDASATGITVEGNPLLGEGDVLVEVDGMAELPLDLPGVTSVKAIIDFAPATSGTDGNFDATFQIVVLNSGNVDLNNLQVMDMISSPTMYGSAFVGVTAAPSISASTATTNPVTNAGYDGDADPNLLNGTSGTLAPGESVTIIFTVEVDPDAPGAPLQLQNQGMVSATGINSAGEEIEVTDKTDSGLDPEGQNNDEPGSTGGSGDMTALGNCYEFAEGALACNDNINLSLGAECELQINPDVLLEGVDEECLGTVFASFFDVVITDANGNVVPTDMTFGGITLDGADYIGQTLDVTVSNVLNGNTCWGSIFIEDKLEPTLMCTDCPPGATMPIELPFTGTLDADSPIWTRPFGQVGNCNPSGAGVDVPYQTHEFLVVTGADSDFENVSFTAPSADFFMVLYQDSFDPLNPCGNMVINNDDGGGGLLSQFDVMLESGTQYILVATTFNNNGNDFGDYIIELDSDAQLIDAPLECLFTCFQEEALLKGFLSAPGPVTMDNCADNLPVVFTDEVVEGEICGSKVVTRTFSLLDDNGDVISSCQAEYQLFPAQFSEFVTPPAAISLPCGTGTSPEEIEAFFDDPTTNDIMSNTCNLEVVENNEGTAYGYITFPALGCDGNEHLQAVDNNMCGFFTTYTDQEIPTCGATCGGSNVKVIRTWTILDWCNDDTAPFTYVQVIESADNEAPTIEVADDFGVSVNPWNCLGDFSLPAPTLLHDLCTSNITYTVSGPVGTTLLAPNTTSNPSDNWIVFGAPRGLSDFTYTAADCCGNTSSAVLTVNVYDTTPPVPVAVENIIVNLTTNGQLDANGNALGFAKIFNTSVDDGSFDGCSGVKIEIAREDDACDERGNDTFNADGHPGDGSPNPNASNYDPDNGEFVKFCCADINQVDDVTGVAYGLVPVRMRVFDDGNGTGFYGDFVDNNGDGDVLDAGEYDNYNETWVTVRVEGKAIASIVCPPDVTLACDMDYTDPAMIGTATTLSLCGSESVTTSFTPQLNACGIGFVIATYTVEGSSPAITCSQRITIENPYPAFDPNGIRFPRDLPTSPTGTITCTDDVTLAPPTWTAGACDFIGYTEEVDTFFIEDGAAGNDACFKILRRFTVIDWCVYDETNGQDGLYEGNQTIKITDREAPVLLDCEPQMFDVDANCVRETIVLTNTAVDNGDCASDWLKWQVFVDTWADGVVDYEYSSFLPTNDSNINNDTNGNGINDRYLAPTSSDEEVSITVTEVIESSMFNHIVTWKVTDGCGNVASCETTFMVVDKKAPTPYCVSLSTALMENSQPVELWAIDFDLGAFDNCTEQEDLRFTFSSTPPEDDNTYNPDLRSSVMSFGTAGNETVNVYVWDEKGNADFCVVQLSINDNGTTAGSRIAGTTATELGNGVENAEVVVEANLAEYPRTMMTDAAGQYAFDNNPNGTDYEVSVNKNDNPTNGVSTLDLVLIQRHIIALADLDSPYKVIAADINRDNKVSSIDVVELRKVILGVQDEFSNNTSWRFVDATQTFADNNDPFPADETRSISDLSADANAEDFVAVKVGDVNATATYNVSGATTEVRSGNTMLLQVEDRAVKAGEQVEIAVSSANFNEVAGLQMTMEFNGLAFNDVAGRAINLSTSNVGVISDNVITMSWNTNTAVSTSDDLFVITAVATKDGNISDMINVTDRVITPEVYQGSALEINGIELGIRGGNGVAVANELMQNEPNPFKEMTSISFNLAKAGKATLTIRDVAGKVIRTVNGEYTSGMNTISLAKSDLNRVGVYYYTLESGTFSETKKMIVIE